MTETLKSYLLKNMPDYSIFFSDSPIVCLLAIKVGIVKPARDPFLRNFLLFMHKFSAMSFGVCTSIKIITRALCVMQYFWKLNFLLLNLKKAVVENSVKIACKTIGQKSWIPEYAGCIFGLQLRCGNLSKD